MSKNFAYIINITVILRIIYCTLEIDCNLCKLQRRASRPSLYYSMKRDMASLLSSAMESEFTRENTLLTLDTYTISPLFATFLNTQLSLQSVGGTAEVYVGSYVEFHLQDSYLHSLVDWQFGVDDVSRLSCTERKPNSC